MTAPPNAFGPEFGEASDANADEVTLDEVQRAVRDDLVFLVYQPVVSFEPRRLVGAEALARWVHRDLGMIPPNKFLALVEEADLMRELGGRLLREACRRATRWPPVAPASRGKDLMLQFNVAASELDDPEFPVRVSGILDEEGLPPGRLRLELEGRAVRDHPDVMAELSSRGVSLMVHDYGLRGDEGGDEESLGIDALKIDRSVIQGLGDDPSVSDTVERAVSLGHERGLEVVAEGVETEAQVWHLQRLGCELGQGFRLEGPMRAKKFQLFCEKRWR